MIPLNRALALAGFMAVATAFAPPAHATLIYEDGVNDGPFGTVPNLIGGEVQDAIDANTEYLGEDVDFVGRMEARSAPDGDLFDLESPDTEGFPTLINDVGESIVITCTTIKSGDGGDECAGFDWDIVLRGAWQIVKIGVKTGGGSDAKGYWLLDPFASDDGSIPGFSVLSGSFGCLDYAQFFGLDECTLTGQGSIKGISHIDFFGVGADTVVSEPLTLALFGLGLLGIGVSVRRAR